MIRVITGPTASGKTALAISLAEANPLIEIVNADASLLYRGFDIGTSKPSQEILEQIPHHLIDILDPNEKFSASDYSDRARIIIREILGREKTPLVVGGTGFYLDALFQGLFKAEIEPAALELAKQRIIGEVKEYGFNEMMNRLEIVDPELYQQITRERNPLRLYRAWEHYYATGEALGQARKRRITSFEYRPEYTVIERPREVLWQRIEARTDEMFGMGWLSEVGRLFKAGVTGEMPAMRAIGYRELFNVIEGKLGIREAREQIIVRTRQYAKRQRTWQKRYESENKLKE